MQDVRIRIGASVLLCSAAFINISGAAAALVWWLLFTPRFVIIHRIRIATGMLIVIAIISLMLQVNGGSGVSYFIRMLAILLIGLWLAAAYQPGEFLHFGVWMGGNRIGFELGIMAEMAMQSFTTLLSDLDYIRMSMKMKGIHVTIKNIIPTANLLIHRELARSKDNAELLAIRGYHFGGMLKPVFMYDRMDVVALLGAMLVAVIAISRS
jgi:energy-coupling factor transport system permease protein